MSTHADISLLGSRSILQSIELPLDLDSILFSHTRSSFMTWWLRLVRQYFESHPLFLIGPLLHSVDMVGIQEGVGMSQSKDIGVPHDVHDDIATKNVVPCRW